ncbi:MAG: segregation/condensation protein A [Clostridia bacterium]|nr:segregation/condensation protein A [Clostridia bacterium]
MAEEFEVNKEECQVAASEQLSFVDEKVRFKLDNFEGPLDLLLHLIKDAKLDIMTVKLSEITEQYLEYMQDLDSIDMDRASEFITVAATLIEIKSKHLLPVESDDQLEEEDSEALLLQRLKEYELFKETGARLREIEDINKMYRSPGKETEKVKVIIKDMVLEKLLDAFAGLLARQQARGKEKEEPKKIVKDRFTVAEKIVSIRGYAREHKRFPFEELFASDMTKSEMINVFLALLELLKLQNVRVEQTGIFQQINVISNED